jgi:hypothetical protein
VYLVIIAEYNISRGHKSKYSLIETSKNLKINKNNKGKEQQGNPNVQYAYQ